jgi:hypothetical protein
MLGMPKIDVITESAKLNCGLMTEAAWLKDGGRRLNIEVGKSWEKGRQGSRL